jgi:hypothetical protein
MTILQATLWFYVTAFQKAWQCVAKNWIVSLAPLAYGIIMSLAALLAAPLGIVGGLLLGVASQACVSSGLHLIKNMISVGKADFDDFLKGFTVYLWDLLTIAFIVFIPLRLAAMALGNVPNGDLVYFMIQAALYVLLNPVPEFIYQTRTSGLELLSASYNFIVENWLEWLLPNILITVAGFFLLRLLSSSVWVLPFFVQMLVIAVAFGLFLTYFMTFRGFLFAELHGTTRRSRIYRYKARSS